MNDIQSFIDEIMSFLTKDDISDLEEKAGVRFPLVPLHEISLGVKDGHNWSDLCYICCWVSMRRKLPESLHNRLIIGENNSWSVLYVKVLKQRDKIRTNSVSVEELFNMAG